MKNAEQRERDNSIYMVYSTRFSNYIGQQKTKLPAEILDNPKLVKKFDEQRKVFAAILTKKLSEHEVEHRLPDKELDSFYERMKQEVMSFVYVFEAEVE